MKMELELIIGIIGMFFILVGFVLDEFTKQWTKNSIRYNVINILGSGMLIYYAFTIASWPFVVLNVIWFISAVVKLFQVIRF
jgi:hypothetical protein